MKILSYAVPAAFVLLVLVFFMGLPDLRSCTLEESSDYKMRRRGKKKQDRLSKSLPVLLVTLIYSVTAFINLGNTASPETFLSMAGEEVELELNAPAELSELVLFAGVGTGTYDISISTDGESFSLLTSYTQSHDKVLKWLFIPLEAQTPVSHVRISCLSGNAWLGEAALLGSAGQRLGYTCQYSALRDEQDSLPASEHFMNSSYFDEVYHPRTAWEHLNRVWPYEISHPPLGKLIIAAGVALFGMTPFGWRFSGTLFGCLMLPVMYLFIKRIFKNEKTALLGTIVFAADFMHFTQTRIATIDTYAVFFILLMYYFMYIYISEEDPKALALSGLFFGLGAASKWTCIYAGAGLGVIWLIHRIRKLLAGGEMKAFWKNVGFCLVFFVLLPGLIYYLSYIPYGLADGCLPFSREYTGTVLDNQQFMFSYHVGVNAEHPYSSRWYQWVLNIRPILYYLEYFDDGTRSSIAAFLNPVTCWGGLICLFVLGYTAIFRRDRRAEFILLGYLAQLLPWLLVKRLTFEYHYFPCSVFLVLAIAYVFELMRLSRKDYMKWCGAAAAVAVGLFVLFYPVLSGAPVSGRFADIWLNWLPTWPI